MLWSQVFVPTLWITICIRDLLLHFIGGQQMVAQRMARGNSAKNVINRRVTNLVYNDTNMIIRPCLCVDLVRP